MSSDQITVITCDACSKTIDPKIDHIHIYANDDALLNFEYSDNSTTVYNLDFCSIGCLIDWIKREVT